MSICDWFSKWRYDKALKRGMDALDERDREFDELCTKAGDFEEFKRQLYPRTYVALHTCPPFEGNPADCAFKKPDHMEAYSKAMAECKAMAESFKPCEPPPKPDTVESVLNQFIALGYDKPEVVIKGFTTHGGGGEFRATIDGKPVVRLMTLTPRIIEVFNSIESAEAEVLFELKVKLAKLPVDTIEVTY